MVPVTLYDEITLTPGPSGIRLVSRGIPVPTGSDNLVFRAARAFFRKARLNEAISIELFKRIPVAAGLGGGSSDAAATLLGLNHLGEERLPQEEMAALALGLGADVPFFLAGGPCLATGIGEVLTRIPDWPRRWYVIVTPPIQVSTAWVYRNYNLKLTSDTDNPIVKSLKKGCFRPADILENDLEAVTSKEYPIVETIKALLRDAGAEGALMTGSGPSVFGIFETEERAGKARDDIISQIPGDVFVATEERRNQGPA
jgi:4-diphosphocytidyl-2-C-methyl-D-erythritol kinase